jgi:hypothetical protein
MISLYLIMISLSGNRIFRVMWVLLIMILIIIRMLFLPPVYYEVVRYFPLIVITYLYIIEDKLFFTSNKHFNNIASVVSIHLFFSQIDSYLSLSVGRPLTIIIGISLCIIYLFIVRLIMSMRKKE